MSAITLKNIGGVDLTIRDREFAVLDGDGRGHALGGMLEENFVTSMIKSDGRMLAFFERPIAATLGAMTLAVWFLPLLMRRLRRLAGIEVSR